jgi:hypothetical protein
MLICSTIPGVKTSRYLLEEHNLTYNRRILGNMSMFLKINSKCRVGTLSERWKEGGRTESGIYLRSS